MLRPSIMVKGKLLWFYSCILVVSPNPWNFMDCPGIHCYWSWLNRQCCTDVRLPKGCECFDISSNSDFTNTGYNTPLCPPEVNVHFLLYTRESASPFLVKVGDASIDRSPFKGTRPTKLITHGFKSKGPKGWSLTMMRELLAVEDLNVFLVDWKDGAKAPNYLRASANLRTTGAMIARLIQELNRIHQAPFESFHLIGHSLGAHASGAAGKEVTRLTNHKLGRISGLDPAGPQFEDVTPNVRLDKSDAIFVDVIHSDAEPLLSSGFGIRKLIGHVDFFPNGGEHQPGCPEENYGIFSFAVDDKIGICSHLRAQLLFTSSIRQCRFDPPHGPPQCTMGYHTSPSCRGRYEPATTATPPFC